MKVGQTVYTVNYKTNEVDSWTFNGYFPTGYAYLSKGEKWCLMPKKCVFESKEKAEEVAKL